jgi:hypothetical protein
MKEFFNKKMFLLNKIDESVAGMGEDLPVRVTITLLISIKNNIFLIFVTVIKLP